MYLDLNKERLYDSLKESLLTNGVFLYYFSEMNNHRHCENCTQEEPCEILANSLIRFAFEALTGFISVIEETRFWSKHDEADELVDQEELLREIINSDFVKNNKDVFIQRLQKDEDYKVAVESMIKLLMN